MCLREQNLKVFNNLTVMCEITRENFEEKYPQIINDLRSAHFISIDCEFTGLYDEDYKCSLFDSPKERFKKLQNSFKNILIAQFGLSTFKYERQDNSFTTSSYTFYLLPSTIFGNHKFTCQIKCIEFLSKQGFDFNKLFHNGVHFVNKSDESKLLRMIEDGSVMDGEYISEIQKYCSQIAEWSSGVPCDSEMLLNVNEKGTFIYLLQQEVKKRFPNLWTSLEKPGALLIKKVKVPENIRVLLEEENTKLKKNLFESILGFSRIMKEIENLKKPIIGHNFLADLIIIYKQFYNPMPISYKEFKKNIHLLFPKIYDTKIISFKLRRFLSREDSWHSNGLSDLYHYLKDGRGATLVIFTPVVNHTDPEYHEKENFHDAGFDSFCTGFCFLKMAHIFSLWNQEKKTFLLTTMPTSPAWLLAALDSMKNQVNLARAQVTCIVFDDKDPRSTRPDLLFIKSKNNKALNLPKITEEIAKYDTLDIQLLNRYSGLMAAANLKQAREVLEHFKDHEEIEVIKYNFLKHSAVGRTVASSVIITSLVLIAMNFSKDWYKVPQFFKFLFPK